MDPIERLTQLFEKFPGIGPRQAQRFVQFLLRSSPSMRREFIESVQSLGGSVRQCKECMRFFSLPTGRQAANDAICGICSNPQRDQHYLAVVANDADLLALERSGTYSGKYFVLGGTISLASDKASGLRIKQLLDSIPKRTELKEVILAFPANPEGDATAIRVRDELSKPHQGSTSLKITSLGRGLSTGSELEYADPETIKSAFEGRR
jgi:recombination protein RecR